MAVPLRTRMQDESEAVFVLDWEKEQIPEAREVSGSVMEFAFGPNENSYLATSYPHRAEYAALGDKRKVAKLVHPSPGHSRRN
jgi:hypothetical protein